MESFSRRDLLRAVALAGVVPARAAVERLEDGWQNPAATYRPHTRWWWPGNAVTREGIAWHLEEMARQGLGGAEIMSCWNMYAKGNIPYLSPEFLDMIRYAVEKAASLGMEVSLTFGPGWTMGGFWVPREERSKVLAPAWVDFEGVFDGELPAYASKSAGEAACVAVVAGKLEGRGIDGKSLVDLTAAVRNGRLRWEAPAGRWRLMAFRLLYTGQQPQAQNFTPRNWVVDYFSRTAMTRYCEFLGGKFHQAAGAHFGKTLDSIFVDSVEVHTLPNSIMWSLDTLALFRDRFGYDLTPYLPAIWWDIGELTPRIRYDVNRHLHHIGMEVTLGTLVRWAERHGIQARVQPHYRFTTELIEAAGLVHRPETEVTTARFEVIPDPRKAEAAGARFYGRSILSAEAYTHLHPERYTTTIEEMKIVTDAFLRDGVTQIYNHGYNYSPERDVAPSRDVRWGNRIMHWNTWWKYYGRLADYIARCCYLLRQGSFVADVLVYAPQASEWTQRVVYGKKNRTLPYGNLGKTLVANGYDFDPVNDDVLQNHAQRLDGRGYRFLIMPAVAALPLKTMQAIVELVRNGMEIIWLDRLPEHAVGLRDWQRNDEAVRALVRDLLNSGAHFIADYKIKGVPDRTPLKPFEPTPPLTPPQRKLLDILRARVRPDVALPGERQSDGLTFLHRRSESCDIYFITNLQPVVWDEPVAFRVTGKRPDLWDPMTGRITASDFRAREGAVEVPLRLDPHESVFVVFTARPRETVKQPPRGAAVEVPLDGPWQLTLDGVRFPRRDMRVEKLASWTEDPATRHFSGTGTYTTFFDLPEGFRGEIALDLGDVGNVAEVILNGRNQGVRFMRPYCFRAIGPLKAKGNRLEVLVTNTLINHVAGLRDYPPVPEELVPHYGQDAPLYQADTAKHSLKRERGFTPLPASGLMGPVKLVCRRGPR